MSVESKVGKGIYSGMFDAYLDEIMVAEDIIGFDRHDKKMLKNATIDPKLINIEIDTMELMGREYVDNIVAGYNSSKGRNPSIEQELEIIQGYVNDTPLPKRSYYSTKDGGCELFMEKFIDSFNRGIILRFREYRN